MIAKITNSFLLTDFIHILYVWREILYIIKLTTLIIILEVLIKHFEKQISYIKNKSKKCARIKKKKKKDFNINVSYFRLLKLVISESRYLFKP